MLSMYHWKNKLKCITSPYFNILTNNLKLIPFGPCIEHSHEIKDNFVLQFYWYRYVSSPLIITKHLLHCNKTINIMIDTTIITLGPVSKSLYYVTLILSYQYLFPVLKLANEWRNIVHETSGEITSTCKNVTLFSDNPT